MSINADPYTVAAELAWKRESLGHAARTSARGHRSARTWRLPWRRRPSVRRPATRPARGVAGPASRA